MVCCDVMVKVGEGEGGLLAHFVFLFLIVESAPLGDRGRRDTLLFVVYIPGYRVSHGYLAGVLET